MLYLLAALSILSLAALFIAPRLGVLLLGSTTALWAYEFAAARYILLAIVGLNLIAVFALLCVAVLASVKQRRQTSGKVSPPVSEMERSSVAGEEQRRKQ